MRGLHSHGIDLLHKLPLDQIAQPAALGDILRLLGSAARGDVAGKRGIDGNFGRRDRKVI